MLTTQEKTSIIDSSKYIISGNAINTIKKECLGADVKDDFDIMNKAILLLKALEMSNIDDILTEKEIDKMYSRLICLLNINFNL